MLGRGGIPFASPEMAGACGALLVGVLWGLTGWLWHRRRVGDLAAQKTWFSELVEQTLLPQGQPWDSTMVDSHWNVEYAEARWARGAAAQTALDWCLFNRSRVGLLMVEGGEDGESGALQRALLLHLWRTLIQASVPPATTLLEMRRRLRERHGVNASWKAFYAQVDLATGLVTYASAGMNHLYVLGRGGGLTALSTRAWGAAQKAPTRVESMDQGQMTLVEGETLFAFTGSLLELENTEGEPFGLGRLQKVLRERPGCGPEEMMGEIRRACDAFCAGSRRPLQDVSLFGLRMMAPYVLASRYEPVASILGEPSPPDPPPFENPAPEVAEEDASREAKRPSAAASETSGAGRSDLSAQVVRPGVLRLPPRRDR